MDHFLVLVGAIFIALSLPGTTELFLLTIFSFLPPRRGGLSHPKALKIAVVIPAHNEELHIQKAVKSLLDCEGNEHEFTVVVVADNCNDQTADLAGEAAARVIKRNNAKSCGKGPALNFAFQILIQENFDAFIILDADTVVEPNFITEFARHFQAGADAVQCRYLVANPDASPRTRLMNLALLAMHILRPRGRSNLGFSCGIFGNGFGLAKKTLEDVPYLANSVVEDLEYHSALLQAGKKVSFADGTTVRAEFPTGGKGVETQRERWEGGRLRMILDKTPFLLRELLKGNFRFTEPLLELLTLPLAFHVSLLIFALIIPTSFTRIYAIGALAVVAFHIFAALFIAGTKKDFLALLTVPFYIFWKLGKLGGILKTSNKKAGWVRTAREKRGK